MRIMAVDLGDARTGLAICDPGEMLASPVGVIQQWDAARRLDEVARAVAEHRAGMVVVGYPRNMDGSAGGRAAAAEAFADALAGCIEAPVRLWDERRSTVSAIGILNETDVRGKKRKAVVDAVAAVVILESFLAWRKNHPDE